MPELQAVQHIRRMRGGSQSHLVRGSDGNYYVTKLQGNPQHTRILANEMLASRMGLWLGLPMAPVEVIEVGEWLIEHTPEFVFESSASSVKCKAGRHLGSRYAGDPLTHHVFDYLPEDQFHQVRNVADFARALVADKWMGNADGRQAVFSKGPRERKYRATFIDQGYCFNAGEWTFPTLPLIGVYYRNHVYREVKNWDAFEPALTKAEQCDIIDIWRCAESVPPEWYDWDHAGLERLVESLYTRRLMIRELIAGFRDSCRDPFPNWGKSLDPHLFSSSELTNAVPA
jgi:hypothetical protein